jgi:hypothetical protein
VRPEEDFSPKHHGGRGLLGLMAVRLTFLWTVDATQTDAFGAPVVEDFNDIAVKDGDDEAGVVCRQSSGGEKDVKEYGHDETHYGVMLARLSCGSGVSIHGRGSRLDNRWEREGLRRMRGLVDWSRQGCNARPDQAFHNESNVHLPR